MRSILGWVTVGQSLNWALQLKGKSPKFTKLAYASKQQLVAARALSKLWEIPEISHPPQDQLVFTDKCCVFVSANDTQLPQEPQKRPQVWHSESLQDSSNVAQGDMDPVRRHPAAGHLTFVDFGSNLYQTVDVVFTVMNVQACVRTQRGDDRAWVCFKKTERDFNCDFNQTVLYGFNFHWPSLRTNVRASA